MTTEPNATPDPELWARGKSRLEPLEFRRAPLLAAAIWFAVGEVIWRNTRPVVMLVIALGLLLSLTAIALRGGVRVAVVPLTVVWMLVGMWSAAMQPVPSRQDALIRYADGLSRNVRGRVVRVRMLAARSALDGAAGSDGDRAKEADEQAEQAVSVDVEVDAIEEMTPDVSRMVPVAGGVRATVISRDGALREFKCGDVVEAPMQLRVPERYRDPGAWQYADYLLAQGIGVHSNIRANGLKILSRGGSKLPCRVFAAQSWATGRFDRYIRSTANSRLPRAVRLSSDDAAMLKAMLFGDRQGLSQPQRLGFQRTGSFHLFVVSGLHVTLLAAGVFWIARSLRLREWLATMLTVGLASAYAALTGFGAPVQRALCMTAIFLVARLLSRERNVLNGLGAAALGVLIWSPASLFESSFQMTFLAVVAIGGIAVPLGERSLIPYARAARSLRDKWVDQAMTPRVAQFRLMLRMWSEAFASAFGTWTYALPAAIFRCLLWTTELALLGLVVEMVMVLPMACYFHRATPFALPANMLSVPMVAVLAPLGVITFAASLLSGWLALLPGIVTALLLHGVTWTVGTMSRVRVADVRVPAPVWWVMAIAIVAWAFCCWAVRRRNKRWAWVAAATLPVIAVMVLWPEPAILHAGALEVTAIDVGQGDSLLVVSPDGRAMLVDAGGPVGGVKETAEAQAAFDIGEEVVSPYLWSRRIRRLDVMVLSHAHSDHMGGMAAVMRSFKPKELWVGVDVDSAAYHALLVEAAELGVVLHHYHAGDHADWSGVSVDVLAPSVGYENEGAPVNNDSLVLHLQYGSASVLLEGDAEASSERAMLANGGLGAVTLLKVGHHGSRTSTTPEFFAAVHPRDAVVSVGKGNTFGHPRFEVIERIADAHTRLYRTDELGLATFLLDKHGGIRAIVGESNQSEF